PSTSTRLRLAPEADRPLIVTPWVVGFATREDDRRNRLKPGAVLSWSSRAGAAVASSMTLVSTVVAAGASDAGAPRAAVTVTASINVAGARMMSRTSPA